MTNGLERLVDLAAITDLMSEYAWGIDRRDAAVYRGCFTDVIDVEMPRHSRVAVAADAWVDEAFALVARYQATQHLVSNHRIELRGDAATCRAELQAQHWRPTGAWKLCGRYENELVRQDGHWKIRRLALAVSSSQRTGDASR